MEIPNIEIGKFYIVKSTKEYSVFVLHDYGYYGAETFKAYKVQDIFTGHIFRVLECYFVAEKKLDLQEISDIAMAWREKAFGPRKFTAPLHHLLKEVNEVISAESGTADSSLMEFSDCLLLLLDAFVLRHPELTIQDLLVNTYNKIEINKKRKDWVRDEHGAFQHVEEDDGDLKYCQLCQRMAGPRIEGGCDRFKEPLCAWHISSHQSPS